MSFNKIISELGMFLDSTYSETGNFLLDVTKLFIFNIAPYLFIVLLLIWILKTIKKKKDSF